MNAELEPLEYSIECCRSCPLRSEAVIEAVAVLPPVVDLRGITKAELEVVRLLPEGISNAEIGRRLFLAEGTIKSRLASVHCKLDTHNRTQVAVWAIRNGLA